MRRRGAAAPGSTSPQQERLAAALAGVPTPADPAFPQAIRAVLEEVPEAEPILRLIMVDKSARCPVRFAALYALLLRLRREERHGEYSALVRQHEDEFGAEPYYHTFRAIAARMRGDLVSLRSSVQHSRQAVTLMPTVPAVIHQLAAFWVEYLERLEKPASAHDLDAIERYVDEAIMLSQGRIAHYHETRGRLLALRGEFDAARAAVAQAIELEPSTSRDHLRRLTQYQTTQVRIDLMAER